LVTREDPAEAFPVLLAPDALPVKAAPDPEAVEVRRLGSVCFAVAHVMEEEGTAVPLHVVWVNADRRADGVV